MNLLLDRITKKLYIALLFFIPFRVVLCQVIIPLDPIIVTASRLYGGAANDTREISVLEKDEIKALPVQSTEELIRYIGTVNLASRGQSNVQCDFSLRGSSFEQVLIMINGIRYNNPQTGHHNCDIPVILSDIQRIEVMPGHGSSLYGPGSFGGVIHIITEISKENQSVLELHGGSYNSWMGRFSQSLRLGNIITQAGIERQFSDGYRFDTDYDNWRITAQSQLSWGRNVLTLSTNHLNKDFGANGFYADSPSYESTQTNNIHASYLREFDPYCSLKADLFFNRHSDHFILDINNPSWYRANHITWTKGFCIVSNIRLQQEKEIAFGYEIFEEAIESESLGSHRRYRQGLFSEIVFPLSIKSIIHSGIRIDHQDQLGFEINPTLGFRVCMTQNIKWRITAGQAYRTPSFIELFNPSPRNIGNPELNPEHAWCGETGFSILKWNTQFEVTAFLRNERNRIDWIRSYDEDPWHVANIGRLIQRGVTLSFENPIVNEFHFQLDYTYLNHTLSGLGTVQSKYLDFIPEHRGLLKGTYRWKRDVQFSVIWDIRQDRQAEIINLIDFKISVPLKNMVYFYEMNNLLNTHYKEIANCPMPGRRFRTGFQIKK